MEPKLVPEGAVLKNGLTIDTGPPRLLLHYSSLLQMCKPAQLTLHKKNWPVWPVFFSLCFLLFSPVPRGPTWSFAKSRVYPKSVCRLLLRWKGLFILGSKPLEQFFYGPVCMVRLDSQKCCWQPSLDYAYQPLKKLLKEHSHNIAWQ